MAVAAVAGCGESSDGGTVAVLVPGKGASRNERTIPPNFEGNLEKICEGCKTIYRDAEGDVFKQKRQAKAVLEKGIAVLVINPVIGEYGASIVKEAEEKGVPVVDYGKIINKAKPDAFVSYNDVRNGEMQTEALARKLKQNGTPQGPIVMLNGEPGNPDEHLFQEGARHGLQAAGVKIAKKRYYVPFWEASQAQREMWRGIHKVGKNGFAGVYAETDGIAEGAIKTMKAAGIDPSQRPTTGRGATLPALRRVLLGEQLMTLYQPVEGEAKVSAEVAGMLAEGEEVPNGRVTEMLENGKFKVPALLLEPILVTKSTGIKPVVADGAVSAKELCAGATRQACREAGIKG